MAIALEGPWRLALLGLLCQWASDALRHACFYKLSLWPPKHPRWRPPSFSQGQTTAGRQFGLPLWLGKGVVPPLLRVLTLVHEWVLTALH